jgi:hypothetical protein
LKERLSQKFSEKNRYKAIKIPYFELMDMSYTRVALGGIVFPSPIKP